jgi:hypothetical protein
MHSEHFYDVISSQIYLRREASFSNLFQAADGWKADSVTTAGSNRDFRRRIIQADYQHSAYGMLASGVPGKEVKKSAFFW